jgi:four helix bundle protein
MASIKRFEDLVGWQRSRELTRAIYAVTQDGLFSRDYPLRDQIRRAAVSVMSNLAEGFEREGQADRLRFYMIAKGSCAELRSQLYVALDAGFLGPAEFDALLSSAEEVGKVIGGLRLSIIRSIRAADGRRYSLLVTRYSLLVTRYSLLVARYSLLVARCSLLVARYSLLVARYSLLVTRYSPAA